MLAGRGWGGGAGTFRIHSDIFMLWERVGSSGRESERLSSLPRYAVCLCHCRLDPRDMRVTATRRRGGGSLLPPHKTIIPFGIRTSGDQQQGATSLEALPYPPVFHVLFGILVCSLPDKLSPSPSSTEGCLPARSGETTLWRCLRLSESTASLAKSEGILDTPGSVLNGVKCGRNKVGLHMSLNM